jgi:hypothetical protein
MHSALATIGDGSCDRGAYDLDGGCTNCVIQYNYSHDNDGPAWLLYEEESPWGNNTVRYNISINDNLTANDGGGVLALSFNSGPAKVYNNTIILTASNGQYSTQGISFGWGHTYPAGTVVSNNLIAATITDQFGRWWGVNDDNGGDNYSQIVMQNNLYWNWTTTTAGFGIGGIDSTLAAWQATGHDATSLVTDPKLSVPASAIPIVWDPTLHAGPQPGPAAIKLPAGSPAIGAGAVQPNNGGRDYFGVALTSPPSIGASQ